MLDTVIIEKEAMQLPAGDRALLADRLIQSISQTQSSLKQAWIKEAESRMAAYRDGKISAVDGAQGLADLRTRHSK